MLTDILDIDTDGTNKFLSPRKRNHDDLGGDGESEPQESVLSPENKRKLEGLGRGMHQLEADMQPAEKKARALAAQLSGSPRKM